MVRYGEVRDQHVDYVIKKVFIPAWDVVKNVASTSWVGNGSSMATLSVGYSVGSPTYSEIGGGRMAGIRLAATTTQVDYLWRIPYDVDLRHGIYFRHHWVPQIGGTTPTITINQWYATISAGTSINVMSPTQALQPQVPSSSMISGTDGTVDYRYQLTGRGSIQNLGTGFASSMALLDTIEAIHTAFQIVSTNFAIASAPVFWMGMDIEYTPRWTFGDGSRREARKMETNLGHQEVGSTNAY